MFHFKIVKHLRVTGKCNKLSKSLKSYSKTRWNTVVDMFESFIDVHTEVRSLLTATDIVARFDRVNITNVQNITEFLRVFRDISIQLESDKNVTSVDILPAYEKIMKQIEVDENDSLIIKKMKARAKVYIDDNIRDVLPANYEVWAFFNPKYKHLTAFKSIEKSEIMRRIESAVNSLVGENNLLDGNDDNGTANAFISNTSSTVNSESLEPTSNRSKQSTKRPNVFDSFQDEIDDENTSISDEISRYVSSKHGPVINLLDWWEHHKNIYPRLYRFFLSIAAIPATSASAERIFSEAGNVITEKRSQLLPQNVQYLVFLHHNNR